MKLSSFNSTKDNTNTVLASYYWLLKIVRLIIISKIQVLKGKKIKIKTILEEEIWVLYKIKDLGYHPYLIHLKEVDITLKVMIIVQKYALICHHPKQLLQNDTIK